jgi:hypothetical protein
MDNKIQTLNSFWFIFNARKSKNFFSLGLIMSLDTIAALQKQYLLGCFWNWRRLNIQNELSCWPCWARCEQVSIGRKTNGIIFTKTASIWRTTRKCIYVYALDDCCHIYRSSISHLFAY